MYSTKRVNKNIVDGNKFISVGDPYREVRALPTRWKGKQFELQSRPMNADNGNFSKLKYASEPFQEMERYTRTQPLSRRNLGFGTKDAFKRGEFTATIRTEQYREMLGREYRLLNASRDYKAEQKLMARATAKHAADRSFVNGKEEIKHIYDIGRTLQNEFNPKRRHDSFYQFETARGKRMGPYRTMTQDIGKLAWDYRPQAPEFGPINHTKNFFDRSHLQCAGDETSIVPPRPRLH